MRFLSLAHVVQQAGQTSRRFPLVVTAAVVATVGAILALDSDGTGSIEVRLMLAAGLGIASLLAMALWFERWPSRVVGIVAQAGLIAALIGFFFAWPNWTQEVSFRRYLQLTLGAHLLAAFLPFARGGQLHGFWQFNKSLFLRFLISQLFSHVLFLGLVIALVALDQLFGVEFGDLFYPRLWTSCAVFFATMFFLGGVPRDLEALEQDTSYPAALKVFAQYILLPIVAIYLVILTAYLGKVLITRVWPSGWIGYLVSSVSVLGILSLLLLFPIQHRRENRWVTTYGRLLYVVLLPSLGMLLAALGKRVDQYGFTENRYFLLVLALWLGGLCIFYLVTRSRNIRWIPTTLCAVALLTSFGPWGAYSVSRHSQTNRLTELLDRNGMWADGKARAAVTTLDFDSRKELSAVLLYLTETHGPETVEGLFEDHWPAMEGRIPVEPSHHRQGREIASALLEELGVTYVDKWEYFADSVSFYTKPMASAVRLGDFDFVLRLHGPMGGPTTGGRDDEFVAPYEPDAEAWVLRRGSQQILSIPLADAMAAVKEQQALTSGAQPKPAILESKAGFAWKIMFYSLHVNKTLDGLELTGAEAYLFFEDTF